MKQTPKRRRKNIDLYIIPFLLIPILLISCIIGALTYGNYEFRHSAESFDGVIVQIVNISKEWDECVDIPVAELQEQITILRTIDDTEAFMNEFRKVRHLFPLGTPSFGLSSGNAILLTYPDGKSELIAQTGCVLIDGDIITIQYHGRFIHDEYEDFINKWLQI